MDYSQEMATAPLALGEYIKSHGRDVEEVVLMKRFGGDLKSGNQTVSASGLYTSPSFFKTFSFEKENQDFQNALKDPFSIVLTQTAAKKIFGKSSAVGQIISVAGIGEFTVKGIIPDPPSASHIQFEVLLSMATLENSLNASQKDWNDMMESYVYLLMRDSKNLENVKGLFRKVIDEFYPNAKDSGVGFDIQHFYEIAPTTRPLGNEMTRVPHAGMGLFLFGVTLVIMISAGFNYTNLSVARSLMRAREVGIRKTSGAIKGQVFYQFIVEAVVIALFALIVAIAFMEILKDAFLNLLGPMNQVSFSDSPLVYLLFVLFALLVGIGAGVIPASILSQLDPVKVLKGVSDLRVISKIGLRKALILFQFVISILFIVSSSVIQRQFMYAMSKELGFEKDNIVNVELKGNDYSHVINALAQQRNVINMSASGYLPATNMFAGATMQKPGSDQKTDIVFMAIDQNFISNLKIQLIAGSNFPNNLNDQHEQFTIVNEQAVKWLGYKSADQVLGKIVRIDSVDLQVLGVVKDFHYRPIDARDPIGPFVFRYKPSDFNYINVRLQTNDPETIAELEGLWKQVDQNHPFTYYFFEDQLKNVLNGYRIMSGLTKFVSILAVSLACLGLLGMTMYTIQTRQKEIAIRKVLGASNQYLVALLSKSFLVNLTTASLIALPLSFFLNKFWLDQLSFKIELSVWAMLWDVALIVVIGLLTIITQTYRAAASNPTKVLN
jgi:putative ABC transport system permease protein